MIEISVTVMASAQAVWDAYTSIEGISRWSFASEDWAAEGIENNLQVGGKLKNRNFAKDGSAEFMFSGTYTEIIPKKRIAYTLDDGRSVEIDFEEMDNSTVIHQRFDPEFENPVEMQKQGWQAYLENFKKYAESRSGQ